MTPVEMLKYGTNGPHGEPDTLWKEKFNVSIFFWVGDRLPRSWNWKVVFSCPSWVAGGVLATTGEMLEIQL